jgi:hypothetical protein
VHQPLAGGSVRGPVLLILMQPVQPFQERL